MNNKIKSLKKFVIVLKSILRLEGSDRFVFFDTISELTFFGIFFKNLDKVDSMKEDCKNDFRIILDGSEFILHILDKILMKFTIDSSEKSELSIVSKKFPKSVSFFIISYASSIAFNF